MREYCNIKWMRFIIFLEIIGMYMKSTLKSTVKDDGADIVEHVQHRVGFPHLSASLELAPASF